MMLDAQLQFSNAQAITTTASSYVYDQALSTLLTGSTYTNPAGINCGPNATYFGEDFGIGKGHGTHQHPRFRVIACHPRHPWQRLANGLIQRLHLALGCHRA